MKISVLTPIHGRQDLTRAVLFYYARCRVVGLIHEHIVIATEPADIELAQELGCVVVSAPNKPLGAKFNAGLPRAFAEADAVMISGSDAVVSRPYLKLMSVLMGGVPWVQASSLYLLEDRGGSADIWYWSKLLTGTGQCVRKDAYEQIGAFYADERDSRLDASLYSKMHAASIDPLRLHSMLSYGAAVLTLKLKEYDAEQITSIDAIMEAHPEYFNVADDAVLCGEWMREHIDLDFARTIFSMIYA